MARVMTPVLSYESTYADDPQSGVLRDGSLLLVRNEGHLPDRCVLCNEPIEEERVRMTFTWPSSFSLAGKSFQDRQVAHVHVGLCRRHAYRYRHAVRTTALGVGLGAGGILSAFVWIDQIQRNPLPVQMPWAIALLMLSFACLIVFGFYGVLATRALKVERIEGRYVVLSGASAAFLSALPDIGAARAEGAPRGPSSAGP